MKILSTMPHSSIYKAASVLGIGRSNVVDVGCHKDALTINMARLEEEIRTPKEASILVISMGEVNTGRFATYSLEQMILIRTLCNRYKVWIHVDGAFGLFARLFMRNGDCPHLTTGCEGIELADSITGDAHKLLNVPYDCGFYFTRHRQLAAAVFGNGNAPYLTPATGSGDDGVPSPLNVGIENSRRFRALPVYATLYTYGRREYMNMLRRQIGLARRIAAWIEDSPDYDLLPRDGNREVMISRTFIVVLFRSRHWCHTGRLVKRINDTGVMYVTGTQWDGTGAARIAVSNWQADVERDGALVEGVLERCKGHDEKCPEIWREWGWTGGRSG